jgi:RNA polymerase sigma-70 factor (ECF subfamily)
MSFKTMIELDTNKVNSDETLLKQIAVGDVQAFKVIYERYQHQLYGFLFNLTKSPVYSEDLLQDVFMKIWEDRSRLVEIRDFKSYLFAMVKYRALNSLKRISVEELLRQSLSGKTNKEENTVEATIYYNELKKKLDRIIRQLPPRQRKVYQMSRVEGLKQEEISNKLHISVGTVKKHLTLSLTYIKNSLCIIIISALLL